MKRSAGLILLISASSLWLGTVATGIAFAAGTAPPLVIEKAEATRGTTFTWLRLEGTFPSGDLVQQAYPLEILVREVGGTDGFVWFTPPQPARSGHAFFTGFAPEWIAAVGLAASADAGARVLHFGPSSLELQLGPGFAASEGEAVFVVHYDGVPVFSNPMQFVIEEAAP